MPDPTWTDGAGIDPPLAAKDLAAKTLGCASLELGLTDRIFGLLPGEPALATTLFSRSVASPSMGSMDLTGRAIIEEIIDFQCFYKVSCHCDHSLSLSSDGSMVAL